MPDIHSQREKLIGRFNARPARPSDLLRQLQAATTAALRAEVARASASATPEPNGDQEPREPQWRLPYADN